MQWTKGVFSIKLRNSTRREVNGYISGDYGIHKDVRLHEQWQITHISSGMQIDSSVRLKDAKTKVIELERCRSHCAFEWAEVYTVHQTWELAKQARHKAREVVGNG